jgi:hypothetical protein
MNRPVITFFVEPVSFTNKQKQRLQKFSNDPAFIPALEEIASQQKAFRENVPKTLPKEQGKRLQDIITTSEKLRQLIFEPNTWNLLEEKSFRPNRKYLERTYADLEILIQRATETYNQREWKCKSKRNYGRFDMVQQVKDILISFDIDCTSTSRDGAWDTAVSIILEICGDALGESLNVIRAFENKGSFVN